MNAAIGAPTGVAEGVAAPLNEGLTLADSACKSVAGYISLYRTIKWLSVWATVVTVAAVASRFFEGSTRIQTTIESVAPDTHAMHDFPMAVVTPRQEQRTRRVRRYRTNLTDRREAYYETEYYTVTL